MGAVQSTPRAVTSNEACQPKANPELEKLNKENSDLKAQLQVVNEKVEALEAQLAEAKLPNPELEQLREEQNDLKARLQTATKYEKQVEVLKAQLENYYEIDKNLAEANQLVKVLQDENKNLQNRELKVSAELKKANDETVEHKKERDEMKKTVEILIVEKEELNKLVDINEKKVADFTDYYNETSPRIRELQNTMNSMELEKNELKVKLSMKRARVDELEQLNAKRDSIIKDLEAEVEKLTQKKNELYELTMSLGEKVRTAENQAEKVLKARLQSASEHAKEVETLKAELDELKSAPPPQPIVDPLMMQRINELEEQKSIAEKKMMEVNQLVQTLHDQNKQLFHREKQLCDYLEASKREIYQLQNSFAEKENIVQLPSSNTKIMKELKLEIEELRTKNDICNTKITKMDTLLRKAYAEAIERSKERDELKKTISLLTINY